MSDDALEIGPPDGYIWSVAIDIGVKNLSFYIEEYCPDELKEIIPPLKKERYNLDGTSKDCMVECLIKLYKRGKTIKYVNSDITGDTGKVKYINPQYFYNCNDHLDKYAKYWEKCSKIVIEKQMAFRGKTNTIAVKMAQHVFSYFTIKHPDILLEDFPAYHKTKIPGAPKGITKYRRKKFCVEEAFTVLAERNEMDIFSELYDSSKKDDIADCLIMIQMDKWLTYVDTKKKK